MLQISNLISIIRLVLTLPMAVALIERNITTSILIGVIAFMTDLLDGYLARKLKQVSEIGKIIDPLADKIFFGTVVIILVVQLYLPLWFVLVILIRDVLILAGGLYLKSKIDFVMPSNYLGKFTATINVIAALIAYLKFTIIIDYALTVATVMMIYSFVVYLIGMLKLLRQKRDIPV